MQFYKTERVALFLDGVNLYSASKLLSMDIDFRRLRDVFANQAHLIRTLYYTTVSEETEFSAVRPLLDWLNYNGYTVVTKPAKVYVEAEGRQKSKINMGVDIAVDAMKLAPYLDHLVLFSGDGDYRCLVAALQDVGKRVTVVSSLVTNPPMVADELRRQADQFVDLAQLQSLIGRESGAMRSARTPASEKS
jgi:uncharacterized LabA/DUF88 family protein